MEHYYLLNGTVKKGKKMPEFKSPKFQWITYKKYNDWLSSLQPCEISESELCLILSNVIKLDYDNPIDITDIVFEKDGKIYFKQPIEKQVDSSELIDNIYLFKVNDYTTILLGRKIDDKYIIQRGDGTIYSYDEYRVTWKQKLNIEQPKQVESECEAVDIKTMFEFTEFCAKNKYIYYFNGETWIWANSKKQEYLTTKQLFYEIFKNR